LDFRFPILDFEGGKVGADRDVKDGLEFYDKGRSVRNYLGY
jgi:hypothetical protein